MRNAWHGATDRPERTTLEPKEARILARAPATTDGGGAVARWPWAAAATSRVACRAATGKARW